MFPTLWLWRFGLDKISGPNSEEYYVQGHRHKVKGHTIKLRNNMPQGTSIPGLNFFYLMVMEVWHGQDFQVQSEKFTMTKVIDPRSNVTK